MKRQSLIWRVSLSGGNAPEPSYLLGTMHVRDAKAFTRFEDMKATINACEVFATEINFEESDPGLGEKIMNLPEGTTLTSLLGKEKFAKIRKIILKAYNIDIRCFNGNLPILLINTIAGRIMSDDMQTALDGSLWAYAQSRGKVNIGIESLEEQINILANIPLDYQLKQLKSLAKKPDRFERNIHKMATLYERGDIRQLYKSSKKGIGGLRRMMIYDRNHNMAERFANIARERPICFAVGAGHLAGGKGMLRWLKRAGFKVKAR